MALAKRRSPHSKTSPPPNIAERRADAPGGDLGASVFVPVTPVRGSKAADLVADQIRNAIIRKHLSSGYLLPPEVKLLEMFSVSRPILREATRILESEGLLMVERGARGGARVRQPGWDLVSRAAGITLQSQAATLGDVYDARLVIEPAAARRAAASCSTDAADALQGQLDKEYGARGWNELGVAVADFHRILLERCGSPTLAMMGAALTNIVERHQRLIRQSHASEDDEIKNRRARAGLRSKQKFIDLIRAGKEADAERHWRQHMLAVRGFWLLGLEETSLLDLL